jgi:protein-tyrosine phosphatase
MKPTLTPSPSDVHAPVRHDDRHLDWDGCFNARDLGGLPTQDGAVTRRGAIVRADALDHLTEAGWAALVDHGVRTVIDLRNDDELETGDQTARPKDLTTLHLPLDNREDREFWDEGGWEHGPQYGTPLYYGPHLERMPERTAAVIAAIADAEPGGVVYHCGMGKDRTGMVTIVLLTLVGVAPHVIADDYELTAGRLPGWFERTGVEDHTPQIEQYLADKGTTARLAAQNALDGIDLHGRLRHGGLTDDHLAALRARFVTAP